MTWVLSLVAILVLGATAVVASGRWGEMPDVVDDRPLPALPEGELAGDDVRAARFAVVTRGYSPRQVDALLARLAAQLDARPEPVSGEVHTAGAPAEPGFSAPEQVQP